MPKYILLLALCATLLAPAGCATHSSSSAARQLDAYVGGKAGDLIQVKGTPTVSRRTEDGGWVYRWRTCYIDTDWHGRDRPRYCETTVWADGDGIVRDWRWWGNECPPMGTDSGCDPSFWFWR